MKIKNYIDKELKSEFDRDITVIAVLIIMKNKSK